MVGQSNATVPKGEDCGYREFMETVDVLVMGRHTYEKVLSFGQWPYSGSPVVVLSQNPIVMRDDVPDCVSHSSESAQTLHTRPSLEGMTHLYVDGGVTIQRFLHAGLIDEITITVIPIMLGAGIPLFGLLDADVWLSHCHTRTFDCGFVQSMYKVLTQRSHETGET